MTKRNKKRRKVPVVSEPNARLRLADADFYKEVYDTTFHCTEEIFIGKMVKFPKFEERFFKTFKKIFDDIYYGETQEIIESYHKKYADRSFHLQGDFYISVLLYITEQAKIHYCDGINTSQQGCIY